MTTPPDSSTDRDYLWDPSSTPEPAVAEIERRVGLLRLDPMSRPLRHGAPARRRPRVSRVWLGGFALAATLVIVTASSVAWRWTWPEGRSWPMRVDSGEGQGPRADRLVVGEPLTVDASGVARVDVARVGSMAVRGGTELTLRSTASNRHRLALTRGTVDVRVWAPPGAVVLQTPAGEVIDLGCIFQVQVDESGAARVSVETGWVQLDNVYGELLVPAGASSEMHPGEAPRVAIYADAAAPFRDGVRAFERALSRDGADVDALAFVDLARRRDVYTLLLLSRSVPAPAARVILARAAALVAPPATVDVDDIVNGDRDALWRWLEALDLPSPKNWWLNWRDAFVRFP